MSENTPQRIAVLGATGGIGSELCRRLAARGCHLAIGARRQEPLDALAAELGDAIKHTAALDATDAGAAEAFITDSANALDGLDGATNLVGSIILKPAHLTSDEELERTLRLNLWTAFGVVRGAAKSMRKGGGSVVLMGTAAAVAGVANHEAIAAAKGAVAGLARSAAATYAPSNIRFNVVAPGLVDTPLATDITSNEMATKASAAMHALGRIGQPEDIAPMIDLLLSPAAAWITGQVIGADGGLGRIQPRMKV